MSRNAPSFKVYQYAKNYVVCRISKKLLVRLLSAAELHNQLAKIDLPDELWLLPEIMENKSLANGEKMTGKELLKASAERRKADTERVEGGNTTPAPEDG